MINNMNILDNFTEFNVNVTDYMYLPGILVVHADWPWILL